LRLSPAICFWVSYNWERWGWDCSSWSSSTSSSFSAGKTLCPTRSYLSRKRRLEKLGGASKKHKSGVANAGDQRSFTPI